MKTSPEVAEFLATLPTGRRRDVERVRSMIRRSLPRGYEEVISKGMLVYQVPMARYADTYNRQALWYVALASTKGYLSLHLMSIYGDKVAARRLRDGFLAAGKKLNAGKACIRFKTADDLAFDPIAEAIASMPVERWIEVARAARRR